MKIIAVINQKGGVGKTTTVANLGAAIAQSGKSICLIDLDPQAHLTLHYGIEPGPARKGVYELLTGGADLAAATAVINEHLSVIPSTIDLAAAEVELVGTVGREQILRDHLRAAPLPYDLIMIDCPPSLGLLTLNALAAADEVVIPLQPHFLALQGLGKLLETVALVQRRINPALRVTGVVMCMYESTTRLSGEVTTDLRNFLASSRQSNSPWSGARIFNTVIRRNIKLAECPSYGRTIFDYEPNSRGAEDYRALAAEFLGGTGVSPVSDAVSSSVAQPPSAGSCCSSSSSAKQQQEDSKTQQRNNEETTKTPVRVPQQQQDTGGTPVEHMGKMPMPQQEPAPQPDPVPAEGSKAND